MVTDENAATQPLRLEGKSASARPGAVSVLLIGMLVILFLFWMLLAISAIVLALSEPGKGLSLWDALWMTLVSLTNLVIIRDVLRQYKRVIKRLLIFGCLGVAWSMLILLNGSGLMACVIPVYVLLAILPQLDKRYFSVLTPKEIETHQEGQDFEDVDFRSFMPKSSNPFSRWLRKLTVGDVEKDI